MEAVGEGVIVTAHTPNYLPGVSVLAKVAHADAVVWLDDLRFTTPGYVNRNQLGDGTWLTVPVERESHRTPIREVVIGGQSWRRGHAHALAERLGDQAAEEFEAITACFCSTGMPLVDLNLELIGWLLDGLGLGARQFRQSDYPAPSGSLTSKVIRMVKAVGGTAYLSGPTSQLDPDAFDAAGLDLLFFRFAGDNPSAVEPMLETGALPSSPLQEVNVA